MSFELTGKCIETLNSLRVVGAENGRATDSY
jgi:hypothetical protein